MEGLNLAISVLSTPLIMFTVLGNLFVIVIIFKCWKLLNFNTWLIGQLAYADLFFSTTSFVEIFLISYDVPYSSHFQFVWNALASSFILVALALERYYAVLKPFVHMKKVGKSLMWKIIVAIWTLVIILGTGAVIIESKMLRARNGSNNVTMTTEDSPPVDIETAYIAYAFLLLTIGLIIPSTIMVYCYSHVIYHVCFSAEEKKATSTALLKSRRKLTKLFIILTLVFIVTWTPTFGRPIVKKFARKELIENYELISLFLALVGSTANPIIYAFRCPRFRQEAIKILSCFSCVKKEFCPSGSRGNRVFATKGPSMTEAQKNTTQKSL